MNNNQRLPDLTNFGNDFNTTNSGNGTSNYTENLSTTSSSNLTTTTDVTVLPTSFPTTVPLMENSTLADGGSLNSGNNDDDVVPNTSTLSTDLLDGTTTIDTGATADGEREESGGGLSNASQSPPTGHLPVPPDAPSPNVSCPDLRDKISIDISITTSAVRPPTNTRSNNNINNNNNNNSSSGVFTNTGDLEHPKMAARRSGNSVILSTADNSVGTVVNVRCSLNQHSVVLECEPGGFWNTSLPSCSDHLDSSSHHVYFAVAGGVAGLVLVVLFFLYCHLLKGRRGQHRTASKSRGAIPSSRDADGNLYVDPYHVGERLYRSPSSTHYARSDITYAKPVVYSTYLNPTFYEDAYQRWRRQEQMVSEKLYDSPWLKPRNLHRQVESQDYGWSKGSIKNLERTGFKKLPRAHLSHDEVSLRSNNSFTSNRTRDHLSCQSLRLYPNMAATHLSVASPSVHVVSDSNGSMEEYEVNSSDGLTNL